MKILALKIILFWVKLGRTSWYDMNAQMLLN